MSGLEVVGVVVNAVQLVGVLKQILTFILQQRGATEEIRAQATQVESLIDIVTEIHQEPEFQIPAIKAAINKCLQRAEALLEKLRVLTPDDRMKKTAKYLRLLKSPMTNTKAQGIFSTLEREKSMISLCIETTNIELVRGMSRKLASMHQDINDIKELYRNGDALCLSAQVSKRIDSRFRLPFQPEYIKNPNFTGRNASIQKLHENIISPRLDGNYPRVVVIHGIGGVGKTQIVQEYAFRFQKEYASILWVNTTSLQSAVTSFCAIAQRLVDHLEHTSHEIGLSGFIDKTGKIIATKDSVDMVVNAVKRWLTLKGNTKWLLLFDNADDLENVDIPRFIPSGGPGAIIITSRRSECARFGYSMEIGGMNEKEALEFLSKSSAKDYGALHQEEYNAAKDIVKSLGYLPLAIDQAGAYIQKLKLTARKYLSQLEKNGCHVLQQKPPSAVWPYEKTVLTTWETSLQAIMNENSEAVEVLQICAFFDGESISEDMLRCGFEFIKIGLELDNAIGTLFSFSLANRRETEDCFSFHTLVQTWARERLQKCEQQSFVEKALLIVAGAAQRMVLESTPDLAISRRLLAQVESCRKYLNYPLQNAETFRSTMAFSILGQLCDLFGHYREATLWFEKDLHDVNYPSPLPRLKIRDSIVTVLLNKGQYTDALEGFQTLHADAKAELGIDHILVYKIANSIGITCKHLTRYEEALSWYYESLRGVGQKFGDMDQRTLATLNNVAVVQKELGRYSEALESYEAILSKKEMSLGKDHPSTLETVMNIGIARMHCQQYGEALDLLQRARAGKEKIWGRNHPNTIGVLGNIATVYLKQGQAGQAVKLYKEVLNGFEKVYGGMNPKILSTAERLGDAYYQQGCYMESLGWYKRALDGFKGIPDIGAFRVRLISRKVVDVLHKLGGYC